MSVISLLDLKAKFETGDIPIGADFVDLIDTLSIIQDQGSALDKQVPIADGVGSVNWGEVSDDVFSELNMIPVGPGLDYETVSDAVDDNPNGIFYLIGAVEELSSVDDDCTVYIPSGSSWTDNNVAGTLINADIRTISLGGAIYVSKQGWSVASGKNWTIKDFDVAIEIQSGAFTGIPDLGRRTLINVSNMTLVTGSSPASIAREYYIDSCDIGLELETDSGAHVMNITIKNSIIAGYVNMLGDDCNVTIIGSRFAITSGNYCVRVVGADGILSMHDTYCQNTWDNASGHCVGIDSDIDLAQTTISNVVAIVKNASAYGINSAAAATNVRVYGCVSKGGFNNITFEAGNGSNDTI